MLEGLEAVELKLSEVLEDNEIFRINSEFFRKSYLKNIQTIKQLKSYLQIKDNCEINRRFKQPVYDENSNLKVINSQYIREYFINYENARTGYGEIVPKDAVLINSTGVGTLGRVNINYLDKEFTLDNHVNVLVLKEINQYYLMSFLQSKYGQLQINRYYSGSSGQIEIYPKDFDRFIIPIFSQTFQQQIENLVKSAYEKLKLSKELYKEAEDILLKELDLKDFKPSKENISIKSFKESFLKSGRLDSEYYQPKYEQIESKIKSYKGGWDFVENILNLKDKNFHPKRDESYKYIELSNIGNTGEITGYTYNKGKELPTRARRLVKKDDVIISSIEGSLEKVALVTEKFDNSLCSTGFYVVNSDFLNSATILVLFKNKVFQQILKQNCSGTILTGINKDDFLNIVIPKIDNTIQTQIEEKIRESFKLKKESKELLELAKRAVEVAIESGEDEAMGVLKI